MGIRSWFAIVLLVSFGIVFAQSSASVGGLDKKIENLNLILDGSRAAAQVQATTPAGPPDFIGIALRLAISLIIVLALIYALYYLARKVRKMDLPPSAGGKALQLLESYHLGQHQKVVLMRVGESKVILLGATPDSMRTLAIMEGDEAKTLLQNAQAAIVTPAQFSQTVNQMLSRFRKDGGK